MSYTSDQFIEGMREHLLSMSKSRTIVTEEPVKKEKTKPMYVS